MNVLSLFDGISCAQIALERANIKVDNYYASEIDKYAIAVTMANYPNTIQLGDITKLSSSNLPPIDLLVGGSPCQGFSFAGKQLNFEDERSKLFFEFVRLKNELEPKYFLLENVKMKKEYQDVISGYLGVDPIEINSALVSAQNRNRLYWTNIPGITQLKDKNILLQDILDNNGFKNNIFRNPASIVGRRLSPEGRRDDYNKNIPICQYLEVHENTTKSRCITTVSKDNVLTFLSSNNKYKDAYGIDLKDCWRAYKSIELERLQTIPDDYTRLVSESKRQKLIGNSFTVDIIAHIIAHINLYKYDNRGEIK